MSQSGVVILDLTRYQAGPYGSLLLADLGAEVIKIEDPKKGDPGRSIFRAFNFFQSGLDPYFVGLNRNKKSLALDVRTEKGRDIFHQLVSKADVVFDNFRPGIMDAWGLGYQKLKEINPKIICCHVSGFGYTGPYRDNTCFDPIAQSMGGGVSLTGPAEEPPMLMGLAIGDAAAGMFAATAIAMALFQRERTGEGQEIDIAMLDAQVSILNFYANVYWASGASPPRVADLGYPGVLPLQTKDEKWIYIVALQQNQFEDLCKAMEREDLISNPKFNTAALRRQSVDEFNRVLREEFAKRELSDWIERLWKHGVPSGPVSTVEQVVSDPQILARNMVLEVEHPKLGSMKVTGNPIKTSAIKEEEVKLSPPPLLGEHTEEVLKRFLALSQEQIDQLRDGEVVK